MSQPKKQKEIITLKQKWLNRLYRLELVKNYKVSVVIAYIGLQIVNKHKSEYCIEVNKALTIISKSKLNLKIEANSAIPCCNILKALISLVIYKRKLLEYFFSHPELPVWNDDTAAPLFDIMQEISKVYKV